MSEESNKSEGHELHFFLNRSKLHDSSTKLSYGSLQNSTRTENPYRNDMQKIYYRKIPNQNIVARLIRRETCFVKQNVSAHFAVHQFHQNIVPNLTIVNIEKPPCFLRKFSPDGRYFVAFSAHQTSLEIYEYNGPSASATLLHKITLNRLVVGAESEIIRSNIFEQFFTLRHTVNVAVNDEQLNRECSLFTDDCNFIIVGSAALVTEDSYPSFFDIYRNNESVSPYPRSFLENYTLYLIDMKNGILRDKRVFKTDKIFLSHNQGLYLYQDFLCVLSVQHQTIHVFQITKEGYFVNIRCIGRFCFEDDELYLSSVRYTESNAVRSTHHPYRDATFNSLKHRFLAFLYNGYLRACRKKRSHKPLLEFYQNFEHFAQLKIWKIQMLDKKHLLIKYASEDVITLRSPDPNTQPSFFVIYNMITTKVLGVYENTSEKLLWIFENFCDLFRNAALHAPGQLSCSPSNNTYARSLQHRFLQTIINAKFGGQTEAVKRLLAQLPISSQSYSISPYLDLSLFSYDDKWVSVMERPKACGDQPIRFYSRDSGLLRFKIHAGVPGKNAPISARRLVAFTFHPYDPFAISVQRTNSEYVVNLHIRHSPCE